MCGEGIYTYMRWTWALVTWDFHGSWTSYLYKEKDDDVEKTDDAAEEKDNDDHTDHTLVKA
ncbi:hypothetical protein Tco_0853832, partial [Tanacetum coccineum]